MYLLSSSVRSLNSNFDAWNNIKGSRNCWLLFHQKPLCSNPLSWLLYVWLDCLDVITSFIFDRKRQQHQIIDEILASWKSWMWERMGENARFQCSNRVLLHSSTFWLMFALRCFVFFADLGHWTWKGLAQMTTNSFFYNSSFFYSWELIA